MITSYYPSGRSCPYPLKTFRRRAIKRRGDSAALGPNGAFNYDIALCRTFLHSLTSQRFLIRRTARWINLPWTRGSSSIAALSMILFFRNYNKQKKPRTVDLRFLFVELLCPVRNIIPQLQARFLGSYASLVGFPLFSWDDAWSACVDSTLTLTSL